MHEPPGTGSIAKMFTGIVRVAASAFSAFAILMQVIAPRLHPSMFITMFGFPALRRDVTSLTTHPPLTPTPAPPSKPEIFQAPPAFPCGPPPPAPSVTQQFVTVSQ